MYKFKSFWFSLSGVLLTSGALFGFILLWLSGGATQLQAAPTATWYVDDSAGLDTNDCASSITACKTIEMAVTKASNDDTIQIAAGTYLEHDIQIGKRLMLLGGGAENTIIDGDHAGRVFYVSTDSTISGVTIRHGQIVTTSSNVFDTGGGAILAAGNLTIQNSVIVSNTTVGSGGAIFNNGQLVIDNTDILSNSSDGVGGGLYNFNLGAITMTNSLVAANIAKGINGGGIRTGQPLYLHNVTVRDNSAGSFGGGLHTADRVVLDGVTLTGNKAAAGAALFAQSGMITFTNVTVSENTADNNQGGVYITGPSVSIHVQNSTIANNHRTNSAGTGYNGLAVAGNASAYIINTIIANNDDRNCSTSGNWTSGGYNLSSDFRCDFKQTGDQEGIDPMLAPLADYGGATWTHALLPGSQAIDSGTNAACPATDQRGVSRPIDGDNDSTATCDKGAFEARQQITIEDVTVSEGDSGSVSAVFTVTLTPDSSQAVTVDYATADGTATSGSDFTAITDTLTFNPGETTKFITVTITGDTNDESDETFTVNLKNGVNADILDDQATGTIVDDDGLPVLTISDQTVLEGNTGWTNALFTVTLSPSSNDVVTVDYSTADDTAVASADFTAVANTLTFNPGETSQQITVQVNGDFIDEGSSESFDVLLSLATNANIDDGQGVGTITDDDSARLSHKFGPSVLEGNSGTTPAVFTVTLSTPAAFVVTVDYAVSSGFGDDGAKVGTDFIDTSGTLMFQPGEIIQFYTVDIIGDTTSEADERYGSLISNGTVPISVNGSGGVILNDDDYLVYLPFIQ